jgi:pyruvate dehydrogenase (quinone)
VRHEEMAAFMACAHAKFTGEVGVCLATSGPGAIHLLNGLYDAQLDHQPVVAIVGQQALASLGGSYRQEVDLVSLFKDVAGEYVHMASSPDQVRHLVDRAVRIAQVERAVTCIILPNDVQEMKAVEKPPRVHGTIHSGLGYSAPRVIPEDADLRRAVDALNAWDAAFAADRPVVLEAFTDPDVPPLPPHISLTNAKASMSTLWKGDPNELGIIKQSAKELVQEFLPHRH